MLKRILGFTILFTFVAVPAEASTSHFQYGTQGSGQAGTHAILSRSVDSEVSQFSYDQNGDLSRIEKDGIEVESYQYDATRKLRKATLNQTETTSFFYTATGEKVLTQLPDGRVEVFLEPGLRVSNDVVRYQYGTDAETSSSGDGITFQVKDHLGSIVATVDSTGMLEQRDTLPYGEKWFQSPELPELDRGFNGNRQEGKLYDYNARHYSPELAAFVQSDSLVPHMDTLGFNRYTYVSGNPVNRIDPSGHQDLADNNGIDFTSSANANLQLSEDVAALKTQLLAQGEQRSQLNYLFAFDAANYLINASPDDPMYDKAEFEVGMDIFMAILSLQGGGGGGVSRASSYGWFRARPRVDLIPFVREFTPTWRLNAEAALAGVRSSGRFLIDNREVVLDIALEGMQFAEDLSSVNVFMPPSSEPSGVVAELQPYLDFASGDYAIPSHHLTLMTSVQEMEMHRAALSGIPTIEIPSNVHVSAYMDTSGVWRPLSLPR